MVFLWAKIESRLPFLIPRHPLLGKGIYQATLHFQGAPPSAQVTMLIMVAGVTVFAEGLAGNVQKAVSVELPGNRGKGDTWRIIPVSNWLITMVSKSPK